MDRSPDLSGAPVGRALERELTLVREAVALVAAGGSPRVVIGGLRFGETLLAAADGLATAAGVRLVPIWTADEAGADIAIERIDHA